MYFLQIPMDLTQVMDDCILVKNITLDIHLSNKTTVSLF